MLKVSLSLEGKGYLHFSNPSLLHRPLLLLLFLTLTLTIYVTITLSLSSLSLAR